MVFKKNKQIFADQKQIKRYKKDFVSEKSSDNLVLSQNIMKDIHSRSFVGNLNTIALGDEEQKIISANIAQMNSSYIIQDPNGDLYRRFGEKLEENGYKVKILDFINKERSTKYNPIKYLDDYSICTFIEYYLSARSNLDEIRHSALPLNLIKTFYAACLDYVKNYSEDHKNIETFIKLVKSIQYDEHLENLDKLFLDLPDDSFAKKNYLQYKKHAVEYEKNITKIYLDENAKRTYILNDDLVRNTFLNWNEESFYLTSEDEMNLENLCEEKTAIFIITDLWNTDAYVDFLSALLYRQAYDVVANKFEERVCQKAQNEDEWNPLHIEFIIQDFSSLGKLIDLPNKLSILRIYKMSAIFSIKDVRELNHRYSIDEILTMFGNTSNIVYFPSNSKSNEQYILQCFMKHKKEKEYDLIKNKISNLQKDECLIMMTNCSLVIDKIIQN